MGRDRLSTMKGWEKKRAEFFAADPRCIKCGDPFDHYSRTMICRKCQIIKYRAMQRYCSKKWREKNREKYQIYQQRYYLINREEISLRKKIRYHEKKRQNEA